MVEEEKYAMRGSDNGEFNSPAAQAHVSTLVNTLKSVIKLEAEMEEQFESMNTEERLVEAFGGLSEKEEDLIGRMEEGLCVCGCGCGCI